MEINQESSSAKKRARNIVFALDPSGAETPFTVEWVLDNFVREEDAVDLVFALELDSEFDVNELGTTSIFISEYLVQMEKEIESKASVEVHRIAKRFGDAQINAKIHLFKSLTDSRNVIVDYVNRANADILIMGSRDLSLWRKMFLGTLRRYFTVSLRPL